MRSWKGKHDPRRPIIKLSNNCTVQPILSWNQMREERFNLKYKEKPETPVRTRSISHPDGGLFMSSRSRQQARDISQESKKET